MKPIVENKGVSNTESVGLHGVQLTIMEVSHLEKIYETWENNLN